jgi:hypothetical protein
MSVVSEVLRRASTGATWWTKNFVVFDEFYMKGWLTKHSCKPNGSGNGYFPVVTVYAVRSLSAGRGGYSTLCRKAESS